MTRIKSFAVAAVAALGITFTPAPVAADSSDLAKALAGLAVLGIIAKTVDDRKDRRRAAAAAEQRSQKSWSLDDRRGTRIIDGELRPRDWTRQNRHINARSQPLPDRCLRVADTNRRDRLVYVKRCLNKRFDFAQHLPGACERQIRTSRGVRTVYGARCLRRDGWQVASR